MEIAFTSCSRRLPSWPVLLFLLTAAGAPLRAQSLYNLAVRARAEVQKSPAQIKLVWPADDQATRYDVSRLNPATSFWTTLGSITTGAATATEYVDNAVSVGTAYEYQIRKSGTTGGQAFPGEGYVLAGIEVPAIEDRGKLLLLVADTHAAYLAADLAQLEQDLVGDGWQVIRHDVPAAATPPQVKSLVVADYQADPAAVKAVFILGHVAVPYSGENYPDGHPDHNGAWPTDLYYGDVDGTWSDLTVNNVSAARPENRNVPGDGKFDQTYLYSDIDLQMGRVDLADLPAFAPLTERDLLRRYLRKDHEYRHRVFGVAERGLIDDHFGTYSSGPGFNYGGFANNGWRNFAALVGADQTAEAPYFATLGTQDYLWAYACGGGNYDNVGGVGSTYDFASRVVKSVFNMQFGSYFGDWDNPNNVLRATLAADGYTLTNAWAGRPNWHFHHMGLGQTIGYSARLTQNNLYLYVPGYGGRYIQPSLLGDPSLRQHVLAPPAALAATASASAAGLSWTASPGPVLGYYVYRAAAPGGPYVRLTPQPLAATAFTDLAPPPGPSTYLVRAVQLRATPTGSYFNLSQGIFAAFAGAQPLAVDYLDFQARRAAPDRAELTWTTAAGRSEGFAVEVSAAGLPYRQLAFVPAQAGGGPRAYRYADAEPGKAGLRYYRLRQPEPDGRSRYSPVQVLAFGRPPLALTAYPTAFDQALTLALALPAAGPVQLRLLDAQGRVLWHAYKAGAAGPNRWAVALPALPVGLYLLEASTAAGSVSRRLARQ